MISVCAQIQTILLKMPVIVTLGAEIQFEHAFAFPLLHAKISMVVCGFTTSQLWLCLFIPSQ